jgi:hypothetical protein
MSMPSKHLKCNISHFVDVEAANQEDDAFTDDEGDDGA